MSAAAPRPPSWQSPQGRSFTVPSHRRANLPQDIGQSAPGIWVRCSEPANGDTGSSSASACGRHFVAGGADEDAEPHCAGDLFRVHRRGRGGVWARGACLGRHIPPLPGCFRGGALGRGWVSRLAPPAPGVQRLGGKLVSEEVEPRVRAEVPIEAAAFISLLSFLSYAFSFPGSLLVSRAAKTF